MVIRSTLLRLCTAVLFLLCCYTAGLRTLAVCTQLTCSVRGHHCLPTQHQNDWYILKAAYLTLFLPCCCCCTACFVPPPNIFSNSLQLMRDLKADALLETNIPVPGSDDSCSCILSHLLGLPRVLVNGCAMFSGPASVPHVRQAGHSLSHGCHGSRV
jgi:hypothetical protein